MKGQAAASAIAVAELAKAGWQGNGDLIFCSVADEEVDVGCGLRWLVEAHPEAVRADYVLNEGGGQRLDAGSRPVYTLGVGETLASTFAIRTSGRAGHASSPLLADNALVKLAPAIERLANLHLPGPAPSALEPFVRTMAGDGVDPHELRERWRDRPEVAWLLDAMLRGSVVPSVIDASRRSTVVPGRARLVCDARLLPGLDGTDLEQAVREALDGLEYDFELVEEPVGGSVSPPRGPLFDILAVLVDGLEPGAALVPSLFAGFTDSHWMREAFGSVAYGFMPTRMDPLLARGLMHGADERIAVEDLGVAAALYMDAARAVGEL
jgi:acetylornithine deacetylase/succinyl-diaminopimelate desuccinylase-like protein